MICLIIKSRSLILSIMPLLNVILNVQDDYQVNLKENLQNLLEKINHRGLMSREIFY